MCTTVALALSEIPLSVIERYKLEERIFKRGGDSEVRFSFSDTIRVLPVLHDGQLRIVKWGSARSESKFMPSGGWVTAAELNSGNWDIIRKIDVQIPAMMGFEKGIWFRIRQGIQGVLVRNERNECIVYMLCERSSHYFQVMTRSTRMPLLIEERF